MQAVVQLLLEGFALHDMTAPKYQERDQETWRRFYTAIEKQWIDHHDVLHPFYIDNVHVLQPFKERIPSAAEIDQILEPIGWKCSFVEGYAAPWHIARMLARRVMPLSRSIRSPEEIFFGREPDLLHDLFGHLPSLMNEDYRRLLSQWAAAASMPLVTETDRAYYHLNKVIVQSHDKVPDGHLAHLTAASERLAQFLASQPTWISIFDKLYFWIFEFGVTETLGRWNILGAGLLSSLSEVKKFALGDAQVRRLNLDAILSPYNISSFQKEYFAAFGVSHFRDIISDVIKAFAPCRESNAFHHAAP
ncbi:hypothetical protein ACMHYB_21435 [Sorangium sp. So ce1128]